jgi:hypothetical protein
MPASLSWVDDFDILEFARFSNNQIENTQIIDIDALATRLAEANVITPEEYERRKVLWRRNEFKSRVSEDVDSAYRTMMPNTKRVKVSSPLSDNVEEAEPVVPRYCKRFYTTSAKMSVYDNSKRKSYKN